MGILIKTVRIAGFRGLENIEIILEKNTVLTGMNNSGKTAFLKALQLALGTGQFISQDDFFIREDETAEKITIDLLIVPTDNSGEQCEDFSENWEILFNVDRIRSDGEQSFVPLRTVVTFDEMANSYRTQRFILQNWTEFEQGGSAWFKLGDPNDTIFRFDEIPFFYVTAQRDILEDIRFRNSYLGKMLSRIEYSEKDIKEIENQIKSLNEKVVSSSEVLSSIKTSLEELDTAMDTSSEGVEITPFTKRLRDLKKGLTIYYSDQKESFSMEYHGTGTRSWSSLLILKAFISLLLSNAKKDGLVLFPILAIEEPEAHLHPNAQKKLYEQINSIVGQKIISTHSPYIAASAELKEIRSLYRKGATISCGQINTVELNDEDIRKIKRQVINTRGEIFFSKMIVFFEGETEEQALPIFFEEHFRKTPAAIGLNFVGVGGHGNYLPFLRFAESLNIPWVIFSDAEKKKGTKESVEKQVLDSGTKTGSVVFLDEGNGFEKQLIRDGFSEEIKIVVNRFGNSSYEYNDKQLFKIISKKKSQYGPAVAEKIIQSDKDLPPKVIELFNRIANVLNVQRKKDDDSS